MLGIIGGMGPEASCYFYENVIAHTKAEKDQEHMTREGHAALAEAVFEKVREILLEKEDSRLIGHVFCA